MQSYPGFYEIMRHTIFLMFVDDFYNYWVHRMFHSVSFLYSKVHKRHHEYIIPISISAEYAHPIEYIFLNVSAPFLGVYLLGGRCHLVTVILFLILKSLEPIEVHSGYEFPWSPFKFIPFSTPAGWHDYHHTHNVGNFSSFFTFWDILLGSDLSFIKDIQSNYKRRELGGGSLKLSEKAKKN